MSINGPHAAAERLLGGANGGCPRSCEMTDVLCCFPQVQFGTVCVYSQKWRVVPIRTVPVIV